MESNEAGSPVEEETWSHGNISVSLNNGDSVITGPDWSRTHSDVQAILIVSDREILVVRLAGPEEWEEPYISRDSLVTDLLTVSEAGQLGERSNHSGKGRLSLSKVAVCIKRLDDADVFVMRRHVISKTPLAALAYSYEHPFGAFAPNFSWAHGEERLVVSCEGKLWYWDPDYTEFEQVCCFDNEILQDTGVRILDWSQDNRWIAAAGISAPDAHFPGKVDGSDGAYDAFVEWMMKASQRQLCDVALVDVENGFNPVVRFGYQGYIKACHWSPQHTFAIMLHRSRSLPGYQTYMLDPHRKIVLETDSEKWNWDIGDV